MAGRMVMATTRDATIIESEEVELGESHRSLQLVLPQGITLAARRTSWKVMGKEPAATHVVVGAAASRPPSMLPARREGPARGGGLDHLCRRCGD
jgi:hypothetical protein